MYVYIIDKLIINDHKNRYSIKAIKFLLIRIEASTLFDCKRIFHIFLILLTLAINCSFINIYALLSDNALIAYATCN